MYRRNVRPRGSRLLGLRAVARAVGEVVEEVEGEASKAEENRRAGQAQVV